MKLSPRRRIALSITALTVATLGTTALPAHAESWSARCIVDVDSPHTCLPPRDDRAVAVGVTYSDSNNNFCVNDFEADGHSAVGILSPAGHPERQTRQWVHWGDGGGDCQWREGLPENADYTIRACLGEWSKNPAERRVLSCGTPVRIIT